MISATIYKNKIRAGKQMKILLVKSYCQIQIKSNVNGINIHIRAKHRYFHPEQTKVKTREKNEMHKKQKIFQSCQQWIVQ